jgi:hypothetical protein
VLELFKVHLEYPWNHRDNLVFTAEAEHPRAMQKVCRQLYLETRRLPYTFLERHITRSVKTFTRDSYRFRAIDVFRIVLPDISADELLSLWYVGSVIKSLRQEGLRKVLLCGTCLPVAFCISRRALTFLERMGETGKEGSAWDVEVQVES